MLKSILSNSSSSLHEFTPSWRRYNISLRCRISYISNSLIIHEENTKEINTETEFGYVVKHLHKMKPTFISIFSLNTDLFEMLDQTLGRVFHQDIQTPRSCEKTRPTASFFNTLLGVWISWWNTLPRVWYITYGIAKDMFIWLYKLFLYSE